MSKHNRRTTIKYYDGSVNPGVFTWQGIKKNEDINDNDSSDESEKSHDGKNEKSCNDIYTIVGNKNTTDGVVYVGDINGNGKTTSVVFPSLGLGSTVTSTSIYGSATKEDKITLVGSYNLSVLVTGGDTLKVTNGLYFKGTFKDLKHPKPNSFRTVNTGSNHTFIHSTTNGLFVGNYDDVTKHNTHGLPFGPISAFIYDTKTKKTKSIEYPGAVSNTAYGIVYNGENSYTICGGYSNGAFPAPENEELLFNLPIGNAYLVDYNSETKKFSNWTSFCYPGKNNLITHFEGISRNECGVYQIAADSMKSIQPRNPSANNFKFTASWVEIHRHKDEEKPCGDSLYCHKKKTCRSEFIVKRWIDISYPKNKEVKNCGNGAPCRNRTQKVITSCNSVSGNTLVGVALVDNKVVPFQAVINFARQKYVCERRWRHCVNKCDREVWDPRWRYDECNRLSVFNDYGGNRWRWRSCEWDRNDVRWNNYDFGCDDWWWNSCDRKRRDCNRDCSDSDSDSSDYSSDDWSSDSDSEDCDLECGRRNHCEGEWQEKVCESQWISNDWRWKDLNRCKRFERRHCRKTDREWLAEGCCKLGSRHDRGYRHDDVVILERRDNDCDRCDRY
jgi:hypothetical protein